MMVGSPLGKLAPDANVWQTVSMSLHSPEKPTPGPWQPYLSLRLPLLSDSAGSKAISQWRHNLAQALSNQSFEFRFDPSGALTYRASDDSPQAARTYSSPKWYYAKILEHIQLLHANLQPPAYTPLAKPTPAEKNDLGRQQGISRTKIQRLWHQWVGTAGSSEVAANELETESMRIEEHNTQQFAQLATWLEEQWQQGVLSPAIEAWYQQQSQQVNQAGPVVHSLVAGETKEWQLEGGQVTVTMPTEGTTALIRITHPTTKISTTIEIPVQEGAFPGASLHPLLASWKLLIGNRHLNIIEQHPNRS